MAATDNTAASAYLKQRFTPKRIQNLVFKGGPAFAMIPKDESYGGENLKVPVSYADIKGTSATFSIAQANKNASDTVAFLITTVEDYALFSIKGKTIKQSRGDMNAWLPVLEKDTKSAISALGRRCSIGLYRDLVGNISTIHSSTTLTGTTLQFANRGDVANFEKGMKIYFANPTGPAIRDSGEALTINSIDRDAGTCVVSAALNTISGIATGDYIIQEGDFNLRLSGFGAWIPSSAPGSTAFFGVDRSVDTVRLGGIRFDATGMNIVEALTNAAARVGEEGGTPSHIFMPFNEWKALANYLGSQVQYVVGKPWSGDKGPVADIGFQGFKFQGPDSVMEVYADRHCPAGSAWMLQMDTWTLHSTGPVPQMLEEDGQSILRESTDDAYEGRCGCYYQVSCDAPGYNCRISNL